MFGFWGNTKLGSQLASAGINVMRVLHAEEEYEYLAPIHPGDILTGITTIVDGKTRKSKDNSTLDILSTETRNTNQDNVSVLTTRSMIVVRE